MPTRRTIRARAPLYAAPNSRFSLRSRPASSLSPAALARATFKRSRISVTARSRASLRSRISPRCCSPNGSASLSSAVEPTSPGACLARRFAARISEEQRVVFRPQRRGELRCDSSSSRSRRVCTRRPVSRRVKAPVRRPSVVVLRERWNHERSSAPLALVRRRPTVIKVRVTSPGLR